MPDVVVVTGGSRGIGAATARAFAERGRSVCLGYRIDRAAADRVTYVSGTCLYVSDGR